MPTRAFSQGYIDPNTGATFPTSCLVPLVNIDVVQNIASITVSRYASQMTYSNGYKPIQTLATQVTGAVYATVFGPAASAAVATLNAAVLNLAIGFLAGAPEYSGATAL